MESPFLTLTASPDGSLDIKGNVPEIVALRMLEAAKQRILFPPKQEDRSPILVARGVRMNGSK